LRHQYPPGFVRLYSGIIMEPTNNNKDDKITEQNNKQALRVMLIFAAMLIFVVGYAIYTK